MAPVEVVNCTTTCHDMKLNFSLKSGSISIEPDTILVICSLSPFTAIYLLPLPQLCCVFSCINSNMHKFLRGTQNMIHATRSLRTQSPSNLVQKVSVVRFRQNSTISSDSDSKHNMDKTQNPNQQKTGLVYTFLIVISHHMHNQLTC